MKDSGNSGIMISVVICTYNRGELLPNALQTLSEQTLETSHYEVIVVDNNSHDGTRSTTESFCRNYPNIRYCFETRKGLSHARNRGWQEAKGVYVAYIDDDCKVPAQWLTVAKEIIDKNAPAVFGGPYYAFYNTPKPYWGKDCYGSYERSKSPCSLKERGYLRGGNIFISRSVLKDMCGFDTTLGMSGHKIGYGEESELQRRIRETMPDALIYYNPKLYVYHLVRPEKMTLLWALNSHFVDGRCSYHVFDGNTSQVTWIYPLKLLLHTILTFLKFFVDFLVGVLLRDQERYPYLQNYLYENTVKYVHALGLIYEKHIHR